MTAIAFIGFGEVASRFAEALLAGGAKVCAYDVLLDAPDGQRRLGERVRGSAPSFQPLREWRQQGHRRHVACACKYATVILDQAQEFVV